MTRADTSPAAMLPVAGRRETWRELREVSRGHVLTLLTVAGFGLVSAGLGLVVPAALGRLINLVAAGTADLRTIVWTAVVMIGAAAAGAVGTGLTVALAARSYHTILAELRERLVARAMSLPQSVVERAGTGDLISRTNDDVTAIADAAPQIIPAFTRAGFTIVATMAGITVLDWRYGLVLLLALPVWMVTVRWYLWTGPQVYRAERMAMSGRAQQIVDSTRGFPTIQGLNLAASRHREVLDASWDVVGHSLRARTVQNMFFGRLTAAEYFGMAGILVVGFWLIGAGQSTVGVATTAMLFFFRLFGPINQLLFVIDTLQSALASLNRIVGVITIPPLSGTAAVTTPDPDVAVQVEGATYRYDPDAPPALDGVRLTIAAGHRVAVVGASGAGKTTLAAVIAGIHHAETGTVTRPERTAVITQETHVFTGTLRDNLTLAAPGTTDDQVGAALEATGAAGLLDLLPDGLDTTLGAGGQDLTAAQAQQIALVRLILANPELAILDEATAEAGSAHAGQLDRAADAALAGRTGLVIAHRLSQAATCDRIIVMEHGRITEEGTHDALVATGGTYSRLWRIWAAAREEGPAR